MWRKLLEGEHLYKISHTLGIGYIEAIRNN